jgi:hypothetical protein
MKPASTRLGTGLSVWLHELQASYQCQNGWIGLNCLQEVLEDAHISLQLWVDRQYNALQDKAPGAALEVAVSFSQVDEVSRIREVIEHLIQ